MAPRESIKATPKVQRTRTVSKTRLKASPIPTIKKTMATRKIVTTQIVNNTTINTRASMAPPCTPKPKESKPGPAPNSVTKSVKKVRKPKAAHSGVPVPSKMLKLMSANSTSKLPRA